MRERGGGEGGVWRPRDKSRFSTVAIVHNLETAGVIAMHTHRRTRTPAIVRLLGHGRTVRVCVDSSAPYGRSGPEDD